MSLREQYDNDLEKLRAAVGDMGAMVRAALQKAQKALTERDAGSARVIMEGDREADSREREIEHLCMKLLLRQQPIASDLRQVSGTLKMVTDLERMGDHAADIAEISLCRGQGDPALTDTLMQMFEVALRMERGALEAFLEGSQPKAQAVVDMDDEQDALFVAMKKQLAQKLAADPAQADAALDELMIAKYLERLGDHAVNVAEWAIFCQTGLYRNEQIV